MAHEVNLEQLQAAQDDQEYVNDQAPREDAVDLILLNRPQDDSANKRQFLLPQILLQLLPPGFLVLLKILVLNYYFFLALLRQNNLRGLVLLLIESG